MFTIVELKFLQDKIILLNRKVMLSYHHQFNKTKIKLSTGLDLDMELGGKLSLQEMHSQITKR